ncbi:MAG: 3-dehydroquinate synthase [Anaerolineales bacterium]|nr:3-dehydroquinate synthase [Anaerolineales bacterium]
MNIVLYGPPGSGKTTVGEALARKLGREFVDVDAVIAARTGLSMSELFARRGEAAFRRVESEVCAELGARDGLVIAPGGGALLDAGNRVALERNSVVFCLRAAPDVLLERLQREGNRPLLAGDDPAAKLHALLEARRALYDSFPEQLDTTQRAPDQIVDEIAQRLQPRTLLVDTPGFRHEIVLGYGLLVQLPQLLAERDLDGAALVVTDENVARATADGGRWMSVNGLASVVVPAGEQYKTLDTVRQLYDAFLQHGLDRHSLIIAFGGGVIGDLTGFAAATFMRGLRWVNVPTTLLAMVDASVGSKTGVDLPQGKNLVGAFHPPALVVADPLMLRTLPREEHCAGMAEVIKHSLIGDPQLFEALERGTTFGSLEQLERAIRVKVEVVQADPFEKGRRATLNLGHTIGHGVEAASGFRLRHGEAVAVGLWAEAWLAEEMGIAERGLAERIGCVLARHGLPTRVPGLDPCNIRAAMGADKKKVVGQLRFALPHAPGNVVWGIVASEALLADALRRITGE